MKTDVPIKNKKINNKQNMPNEEEKEVIVIQNGTIKVGDISTTVYPNEGYSGNLFDHGQIKIIQSEDIKGICFCPKIENVEIWITVNHVASSIVKNWQPLNPNIMFYTEFKTDLTKHRRIPKIKPGDQLDILFGSSITHTISVSTKICKIYLNKAEQSNMLIPVCITAVIDYNDNDIYSGGIMVSDNCVYMITYGKQCSSMIELYAILLDPRVPLIKFEY